MTDQNKINKDLAIIEIDNIIMHLDDQDDPKKQLLKAGRLMKTIGLVTDENDPQQISRVYLDDLRSRISTIVQNTEK